MKILIIRHGDPDYSIDSLTEKGWREAEMAAEKISALAVKAYYVSPMGRAKDTASCTLKKVGREATECEWLREFSPCIYRPDVKDGKTYTWDWLPEDWTQQEEFFQYDKWYKTDVMKEGFVKQEYDWVTENFDLLLKSHGYERAGHYYKAVSANNDTIVLFCHFGVECVLLSHLLNISPMVLWHGTCAAPSSITTVVTEERREGTAYFRMSSFGDTSHLYINGEPPSFQARFCECYDNVDERHD